MAKKQTPAQQALELAKKRAAAGDDWIAIHNAIFGIGGLSTKLFESEADRIAFSKSAEYSQIMSILDAAPDDEGARRPDVSGKFVVRLPKSLHAALLREAEAEKTSLNQLVISKLSAQLRAIV